MADNPLSRLFSPSLLPGVVFDAKGNPVKVLRQKQAGPTQLIWPRKDGLSRDGGNAGKNVMYFGTAAEFQCVTSDSDKAVLVEILKRQGVVVDAWALRLVRTPAAETGEVFAVSKDYLKKPSDGSQGVPSFVFTDPNTAETQWGPMPADVFASLREHDVDSLTPVLIDTRDGSLVTFEGSVQILPTEFLDKN